MNEECVIVAQLVKQGDQIRITYLSYVPVKTVFLHKSTVSGFKKIREKSQFTYAEFALQFKAVFDRLKFKCMDNTTENAATRHFKKKT